ncbi:MAG: hypothetical protein Q7J44_03355 [Pseudotabrizicola sp.]|uniref:hypothetical protein n=1 Tax=Pseudotabrizicola sp. TaxID=2939647 RepID=UPI002726993E|nr:hypothetical protein [Pseudotabrizicola sp.]MDO9637559.1 hypothetical protein [Pseudotabrizicola sp.]
MPDTSAEILPVLAELRPSPPRRVVGVVLLAVLGASLVYLALTYPAAAIGWTVFLLGFGAACLWLSVRMWQSTGQGLMLTRAALSDHHGVVLARVDQIRAVRRGVFAFKPAGGFTLLLAEAAPRGWAPGLWWRLGRSVGVGGVTHRHEARYMAEVLNAMIRKE